MQPALKMQRTDKSVSMMPPAVYYDPKPIPTPVTSEYKHRVDRVLAGLDLSQRVYLFGRLHKSLTSHQNVTRRTADPQHLPPAMFVTDEGQTTVFPYNVQTDIGNTVFHSCSVCSALNRNVSQCAKKKD